MKLEKIGNNINSFEKNAFLKIIDTLIAAKPKNAKAIESMSLRICSGYPTGSIERP